MIGWSNELKKLNRFTYLSQTMNAAKLLKGKRGYILR